MLSHNFITYSLIQQIFKYRYVWAGLQYYGGNKEQKKIASFEDILK